MTAVRVMLAGADRVDRQAWLDARRTGLGGSDAATLLDLNPYSSRWALWLDKTGRTPHSDGIGPKGDWGHRLESVVRAAFTEQTGIPTRRHGMVRSVEHEWMLYSPDAVTGDGGIYEGKTSHWRMRHQWDDDAVPDLAYCQVQWGMAVTGRPHAWLVGLIDGYDLRIRRVTQDPDLIGMLVREGENFWGIVQTDTPPAITGGDLDAIQGFHRRVTDESPAVSGDVGDLVGDYQRRTADAKDALEKVDAAKARLVDAIGGHDRIVDLTGAEWATRREQTSRGIDVRRLRADHPDLAAEYEKTTLTRVLRVHRTPKPRQEAVSA